MIGPTERCILSMSSWSIVHQELAGKRRRMGQLLVRLKLFEWCRRQASDNMVEYECHHSGSPSGRSFNTYVGFSKCHHLLVAAVALESQENVDNICEARKL